MRWQSLAMLFGIISELLNIMRCLALRCSHELALKKLALMMMKGITSAHSKMPHLLFWLLIQI